MNEPRQKNCGKPQGDPPGFIWKNQVVFDERKGDQERQQDEESGNQTRRNIDTESIGEIVDRFEEELVDESIPDFLADFVIFVKSTDEKLQHQEHDEIRHGLLHVESADLRGALIRGRPEGEDDDEVEEGEESAQREVPPIDDVALQADEEDVPILVERSQHGLFEAEALDDFLSEIAMRHGAGAKWIVFENRFPKTRCFAETHRAGN